MSVASEITRLQAAKADIKASIEANGVTVPSDALIDQYANYVDQILKNLIERDITSVTIPNSVTSIGNYAFSGCTRLTSVTIPNSVTSIGGSAFEGCKGLTSITIPDSVTSIGNSTFQGCTSLTTVTIPNSVTSIGGSAFSTSSITSITIPNGVTIINDYTFNRCSGLTNITIPNSVTSIRGFAFYYCRALTSVTIQATTPPSLANVNAFNYTNNCPIYVPSESVDAYKAATNWSSLAGRIQAITE